MQIISISPQESHTYASGWSHLNQWGDEFKVKLLAWKQSQSNSANQSDLIKKVSTVIAPKGKSDQVVEKALLDTFSGSSCQHEYDCCGCEIVRANVSKIKNRTWRLQLDISYNH